MEITKNFTGGNIEVTKIQGDEVLLKNELRDTTEDWFYWAFCVENAAGRTIHFQFDKPFRVGCFGAAVSYNLRDWLWSESKTEKNNLDGFSYTFGKDENRVYFAHNMLYHPDRFFDFAAKNNLKPQVLCHSEKGRAVPFVTFGEGDKYVCLTARHHACEATGSYLLEGVIENLLLNPIAGYKFFCVPFVDYDGVVDGDQGKARKPYDHNRDYDLSKPALYRSVDEIRKFALSHNVIFGFDFHSPWHCGGENDHIMIPKKSIQKLARINKFSEIYKNSNVKGALKYTAEYDVEPNVRWNKADSPCFGTFISGLETAEFAFTLETPYFGVKDDRFTNESALAAGKSFADAICKYVNEML